MKSFSTLCAALLVLIGCLCSCAASDLAHCKRPKQASSRAFYKH